MLTVNKFLASLCITKLFIQSYSLTANTFLAQLLSKQTSYQASCPLTILCRWIGSPPSPRPIPLPFPTCFSSPALAIWHSSLNYPWSESIHKLNIFCKASCCSTVSVEKPLLVSFKNCFKKLLNFIHFISDSIIKNTRMICCKTYSKEFIGYHLSRYENVSFFS